MSKTRGMTAYLLLILVFGFAGWTILQLGNGPTPSVAGLAAPGAGTHGMILGPLPTLLIQLVTIMMACLLCGNLFRKIGQPAVVGQMAAGILLGPSLLGWAWPAAEAFLFPPASLSNLSLLSKVGILLFMFGVGLDMDLGTLRKHARTTLFVSHASIVIPFFLGLCAALLVYRTHAPQGVRFLPFALFMGIAMSITAFPVLARILEERGLTGSTLGITALGCAAVDDVTAWSILAVVIAVARAESPLSALWIAAGAALYVVFMLYIIRPLLSRWLLKLSDPGLPGKGTATLLLIGLFLSALATETLGIHALFGAFLAGAIIPDHIGLKAFLKERLEYSASLYLLPIFFAATGLRTELSLLNGAQDWGLAALILVLAVVGKMGGGCLAARFMGTPWKQSFALGALMNTRGLMELIVLNIGLDLGILTPALFSMMVLMALATTAMTGPALSLLKIGRRD